MSEKIESKECSLAVITSLVGIRNVNSSQVEEYLTAIEKLAKEMFPDKVRAIQETDFFPVPTNEELEEVGLIGIPQEPRDGFLLQSAMQASCERSKWVFQKIQDEFYDVGARIIDVQDEADMKEMLDRLGLHTDDIRGE